MPVHTGVYSRRFRRQFNAENNALKTIKIGVPERVPESCEIQDGGAAILRFVTTVTRAFLSRFAENGDCGRKRKSMFFAKSPFSVTVWTGLKGHATSYVIILVRICDFLHVLHWNPHSNRHSALCDILHKRLRNTLTYLLTYLLHLQRILRY